MSERVDPEEQRTAIALFRYTLILPLLRDEFEPGSKGRLREQIAAGYHEIPHSTRRSVSVPTLARWERQYKQDGFDGLKPKPRDDRGQPRSISPETLDRAEALKRELPSRSTRAVVDILKREAARPVAEERIANRTLSRQLAARGATSARLTKARPVFRRFERSHPSQAQDMLWRPVAIGRDARPQAARPRQPGPRAGDDPLCLPRYPVLTPDAEGLRAGRHRGDAKHGRAMAGRPHPADAGRLQGRPGFPGPGRRLARVGAGEPLPRRPLAGRGGRLVAAHPHGQGAQGPPRARSRPGWLPMGAIWEASRIGSPTCSTRGRAPACPRRGPGRSCTPWPGRPVSRSRSAHTVSDTRWPSRPCAPARALSSSRSCWAMPRCPRPNAT
jgi:transposase